uniref:Uncharacterized protein n=1 Tax=Poecilia latipinna TaxID=48699 RepID=A0A3B3U0N7_9TELE
VKNPAAGSGSVSRGLRAMFFMLTPNESSFEKVEEVPQYVQQVDHGMLNPFYVLCTFLTGFSRALSFTLLLASSVLMADTGDLYHRTNFYHFYSTAHRLFRAFLLDYGYNIQTLRNEALVICIGTFCRVFFSFYPITQYFGNEKPFCRPSVNILPLLRNTF